MYYIGVFVIEMLCECLLLTRSLEEKKNLSWAVLTVTFYPQLGYSGDVSSYG